MPTCPSCKCFKLRGPAIEGFYSYKYAQCVDVIRKYAEASILANQVIYACGVENSFVLPLQATIEPICCDDCIGVIPGCTIPEAFCYTVTLTSGSIAFFEYLVPVDDIGNPNMIVLASVSSFLGSTKTICARAGSIIQTGGAGTISISAAGIHCTTTPLCNAACICVTLTNDEIDGYDVVYSYVGCDGVPVDDAVLTQLEGSISFCMLDGSFSVQDMASLYTLTSHGDCLPDGICEPPVPAYRYTAYQWDHPYDGYYNMEKEWLDPVYTYQLESLLLNDVEYANGQTITINSPGDLLVAPGVFGGVYYQNISDWLNSIAGVSVSGFVFHDNMCTIDIPDDATSTFTIKIVRTVGGGFMDSAAPPFYYWYVKTPTFVGFYPSNLSTRPLDIQFYKQYNGSLL